MNTLFTLIKPILSWNPSNNIICSKLNRSDFDVVKDWYLVEQDYIESLEKELESVHSGNTNPIKLPGKLPYMTMLRVKTEVENIES